MNLKSYNNYKSSDIQWLGDIPEHWEVNRIKHFCNNITDGAHTSPDLSSPDYPFLSVVNLKNGELNFKNALRTSKIDYERLLRNGCRPFKGNVLFSKDGTIGETVEIKNNFEFVVGSSFIILRPKSRVINSTFFNFLLSSSTIKQQTKFFVRGTGLPRISIFNTAKLFCCIPPLTEQTKIANYLDQKTTAIDKKIDLLTTKIKHYQTLKKSLINETVCRGLDKSVALKDSGVEWIGKIPKHWEVKRTKDFLSVNMGQSPNSTSFNIKGQGIPFYQGKTDFGKINPKRRIFCTEPRKIADKDDILISVRAPVGEINIANETCCIGRGLAAMKIIDGILKYHYYQILVIRQELKLYTTGSTFGAVSANHLTILSAIFPPKSEQQQIANYLDEKTGTIAAIINNLQGQIERLRELRKVLINDVVTGKVEIN